MSLQDLVGGRRRRQTEALTRLAWDNKVEHERVQRRIIDTQDEFMDKANELHRRVDNIGTNGNGANNQTEDLGHGEAHEQ